MTALNDRASTGAQPDVDPVNDDERSDQFGVGYLGQEASEGIRRLLDCCWPDVKTDYAVMLPHRKGPLVCEILVEGDDECIALLGPTE